MIDMVQHPKHYAGNAKCKLCQEPIECIDVAQHHNFNIGNAFKYLWRAGLKDKDAIIQDYEKAIVYINFEIQRLEEHHENGQV